MGVFITIIGVAALIAGVVLLYVMVIPEKLNGTFGSKVLQWLHDYFNFKKLYLEDILKFIFTVLTVACFAIGIMGILGAIFGFFQNLGVLIEYGSSRYFNFGTVLKIFFSTILGTIVTVVVGPVVLRLVYEGTMMFILLVKNVVEINNKTKMPENKTESTVQNEEKVEEFINQ